MGFLCLFCLGGTLLATGSSTWPVNEMFADPNTTFGTYHHAVAGEFLNDNYNSIAILEDTDVRIFGDPLIYRPQQGQSHLVCEYPGNWLTMDSYPGGCEGGEADALIVAGPMGMFLVRWSHVLGTFEEIAIGSDPNIYKVRVGDVNNDGDLEVVAASLSSTSHVLDVYEMIDVDEWDQLTSFDLAGTAQAIEILNWTADSNREIAVVQQGVGLDVFPLVGNPVRLSIQLSMPYHPDSLAVLDATTPGGTDRLAWVTGTGNGEPTFNDQFLFVITDISTFQILYLGTCDVRAIYPFDPDMDGYQDLVLLNRYGEPFRLKSYEETRTTGQFYGNGLGTIDPENMEYFELQSTGPFTGVESAFAIGDADFDGDPDAYFAFQDTTKKKLYFYRNGHIDHNEQIVTIDNHFSETNGWEENEAEETYILNPRLILGEHTHEVPAWANYLELMAYTQETFGVGGIEPVPVFTGYINLDKIGVNDFEINLPPRFTQDSIHHYYFMIRFTDQTAGVVHRYGPVATTWLNDLDTLSEIVGTPLNNNAHFLIDIEHPNGNDPTGTGTSTGGSGMGSDNDRPGTGTGTPPPPPAGGGGNP